MIMVAGAGQKVLEDQLRTRTSAASRMVSVMTKLYQRTDAMRISKSIILKMEIAVSQYVYLKIDRYSEAATRSSKISLENTCVGVSS